MLKALLWKEWREQRVIAAAGLAMTLLLPAIIFGVVASAAPGAYVADVADMVPFMLAVSVWPLFAALAGASTSGDEAVSGRLGFLLSRPIGRGPLWLVKVLTAAAALAIIVGGSFAVGRLIDWMVGGYGFQFPFSSDPLEMPGPLVQMIAVALAALAFAGALLCGVFVRRQLTAAFAGGIVALAAVFSGVYWLELITGSVRAYGGERFLASYFGGALVAILAAAFLAFRAGAMLPGVERRRMALIAVAVVVPVMLSSGLLAAHTTTRSDVSEGALSFVGAVPGGDAIIVRSQRDPFTGSSLWSAGHGRPMRQLTDRLATFHAVTPDGEWLLYTSRLGPLETRRDDCELRAVRVSGGADRLIQDHTPCSAVSVLSHDGTRLAMRASSGLMVVRVDGGSGTPVMHQPSGGQSGWPEAWSADDRRVLWRTWRSLSFVDADSGETTELFSDADADRVTFERLSSARAIVRMRYRERTTEDGKRGSELVHLMVGLEDGDTTEIGPLCVPWDAARAFVNDGAGLVYPQCPEGVGRELWLRDLGTGQERRIATFEQEINGIEASPSGRLLWIRLIQGDGYNWDHRHYVAGLDGAPRELELPEVPVYDDGTTPSWSPTRWEVSRWLDDGHLLAWRYHGGSRYSYARVDVATGSLELLTGDAR